VACFSYSNITRDRTLITDAFLLNIYIHLTNTPHQIEIRKWIF